MFTIECPRCKNKANLPLTEPAYDEPYRCWRCNGLFLIRAGDGELKSCQPLSEEELKKYNKNKMVGG